VKIYEVDLNEIRPRTWRVMAEDEQEAFTKAMSGQGEDISGVDYTEGEIVAVREVSPS
jgi:hypothetical protein